MNVKIIEKNGDWLKVEVERGDESDEAVIKAIDPDKYEVGKEYKGIWTDYAKTQDNGLVVYQEKEVPTFINDEGEKEEAPEMGSIPDTSYIIGFLEALSVVTFEAAGIEMDLEQIRFIAADRAAQYMQRGQL